MLAALAVSLVLAQPAIVQPPRLRASLPNGSGILVERMSDSRQMSVQLLATSPAAMESKETHGMRHLLEHLMAKGPSGDLDARLERKGLLLLPETSREVMTFEIIGDPAELDLALQAIKELLSPPTITAESIANEIPILGEELALQPPSSRLASAAWSTGFGGMMPDALGSLEVMKTTTPEQLVALHRAIFQDGNLVLSISGPMAMQATLDKARAVMSTIKPGLARPTADRPIQPEPKMGTDPAMGAARAAGVPGFPARETLHSIVVGLALAQSEPSFDILYTPSIRNGLVILTGPTGALFEQEIDQRSEDDIASLYPIGQSLALTWLKGITMSPSQNAKMRGLLMLIRRPLRLEDLVQSVEGMTLDEFKKAFDRFRKDRAVRVNG